MNAGKVARVAGAVAVGVSLVACSTAGARTQAPAANPAANPAAKPAGDSGGISIRIPDEIAGFRMIERKSFDDPALGTMVRYLRADSTYVDVFLYPGPDFRTGCDSACARDVLEREGTGFVRDFPTLLERRYVDTIAVASDSALRAPPGAAWRIGRHMRFVQQRKGRPEWSDFYLYYLPDVRVKLRASYPRDTARQAAVARFAAEAVPALVAGARRGPREKATAADAPRSMMVSTNVAGSMAVAFALVVRLLGEHDYVVEDSSSAQGRIVTAPRFTWPKGSEKESWHGAESPGVRLRVMLSPRGDSTKVEISGQSPTRAGWSDAKVAQMLELLSVMELAAALPSDEKKAGQ